MTLIDRLAARIAERYPETEGALDKSALEAAGATTEDAVRASMGAVLAELEALGCKILEPEPAAMLGQRAYDAYGASMGGLEAAWMDLSPKARGAWIAAVAAVRRSAS
jgi:hypothetical protein